MWVESSHVYFRSKCVHIFGENVQYRWTKYAVQYSFTMNNVKNWNFGQRNVYCWIWTSTPWIHTLMRTNKISIVIQWWRFKMLLHLIYFTGVQFTNSRETHIKSVLCNFKNFTTIQMWIKYSSIKWVQHNGSKYVFDKVWT